MKNILTDEEIRLIASRIKILTVFNQHGIRYMSANVTALILRTLCGGWKQAIWFLLKERFRSFQIDLFFFWHETICRRTPADIERRISGDDEADEFEEWIEELGEKR